MSWSKDFGKLPSYGFKTQAYKMLEDSKDELEAQNPGCMAQVRDVIDLAFSGVTDGAIGHVDSTREVQFSASGHYSADNEQVNSVSINLANMPKPVAST